jgi:hypothetical protein
MFPIKPCPSPVIRKTADIRHPPLCPASIRHCAGLPYRLRIDRHVIDDPLAIDVAKRTEMKPLTIVAAVVL